jgi:ketosteroid isomerase-like protein
VDLHEEAFDAVRKWWRAWVERDLGTVELMTDPDYFELTEAKHVRPLGIAQLLEEASRYAEQIAITDWDVYEPVTKVFERTVSCSYCFRIAGRRGGRRFSFSGRATDVLVKKEDHWAYMSHHGTLEGGETG